MWSVFIADDEPKIRKRLQRLVDEAGDFEVCGEAADGLSALEAVRLQVPDILLVDICMPRLNGLDFIEQLEDAAQDSAIIVVTGHDEFDYARRAVTLPIFDYLLKPVESSHFQSVLFQAAEDISGRRKRQSLLQWAENQVMKERRSQVDEFIHAWMRGELSSEEVMLHKKLLHWPQDLTLSFLCVHIDSRLCQIAALELHDHVFFTAAIEKLVQKAFGAARGELSFSDSDGNFFYCLPSHFEQGQVTDFAKNLQEEMGFLVSVASAMVRTDFAGFVEDLKSLRHSIEMSIGGEQSLERIFAYIDQHYPDKELTLESAAEALSRSPGYVSRLLKRHSGYSFSEFTNRFRVLQSLRLLQEGELLMYEIAEAVGYSSQHYFSRIFRRFTGKAPMDYLKEGS